MRQLYTWPQRILDEPLGIEAAGRRITTTYSDHCGVRLAIDPSGTESARTTNPNPR
ncbi:MAG: hypothetical protein JWP87_1375 [Labilithrix sp.]|nr:hypothetical protein [Labilithrix sp.]